jgi:thiol-disulfide isomerase/thioredoxin
VFVPPIGQLQSTTCVIFIALACIFAGCNKPESAIKIGDSSTPSPEKAPAEKPAHLEPTKAIESTVISDSVKENSPTSGTAPLKKAPIYSEESNGKQLISAALLRAKREKKHVLVEWGGNWCGWCYKLHDVFQKDTQVQPIVFEEFELVLIDERKNHDLILEYGGKDRQYSYPHLTVLDWNGNVLTNQETGSLEDGPKHDPKLVAKFLKEWSPPKVDAQVALANSLQVAKQEGKKVLVRVGTPYCGWCKVLSQFMQENESVFEKDYIDLKLDTYRMTLGKETAERLKPKGIEGDPWMVILDDSGKELANSLGPQGNIGCPSEPSEILHFASMIESTKQRITASEIEAIQADLTDRRKKRAGKN